MSAPSYHGNAALLSTCKRHRYLLYRDWASASVPRNCITWVMLNPSTADAKQDDPTVRRCVEYSRRWGHNELRIVNLWSWRATDPAELQTQHDKWLSDPRTHDNPTGGEYNDRAIRLAVMASSRVVFAWGANALSINPARADFVADMVSKLEGQNLTGPHAGAIPAATCLGKTKHGAPRHPVRLAYSTQLIRYAQTETPIDEPSSHHKPSRRKRRPRPTRAQQELGGESSGTRQ